MKLPCLVKTQSLLYSIRIQWLRKWSGWSIYPHRDLGKETSYVQMQIKPGLSSHPCSAFVDNRSAAVQMFSEGRSTTDTVHALDAQLRHQELPHGNFLVFMAL